MRHTRWFHLRVIGDQQLARRYLPAVRTVLGQVASRAELGLLTVAYHTEKIAEGVTLQVDFIHGRLVGTVYAGLPVTETDVPIPLTAGFICMPLSEEFPLPDGVSPGTTDPLRPDVLLGLSYEASRAFQPPKYEYTPFYYDVDHMPPEAVAAGGIYKPVDEDYLARHTKFGYPTLYGGNCDWIGHEKDQLSCSWFKLFGRYGEGTYLEDNHGSFGGAKPCVFFRGATIIEQGTVINDSELPVAANEFVLGAGMKYVVNAEGVAAGLYIFVALARQTGYDDPETDLAIRFVRWRVRSDLVLGYKVEAGVVLGEWTGEDIIDPEETASPGSLPVIDLRGSVLAFNASCTTARMACFRLNYKPLAKLQFDFTASEVDLSYTLVDEPAESEEYVSRPSGVVDYYPVYVPFPDGGVRYFNAGARSSHYPYGWDTQCTATLGWDYDGDTLITVKLRIEAGTTFTSETATHTASGFTTMTYYEWDYHLDTNSSTTTYRRQYLIFERDGAEPTELQIEDVTTVSTNSTVDIEHFEHTSGGISPTETRLNSGTKTTTSGTTKTVNRKHVAKIDARIGLLVYVEVVGTSEINASTVLSGPRARFHFSDSSLDYTVDSSTFVTTETENTQYELNWTVHHGASTYVFYTDTVEKIENDNSSGAPPVFWYQQPEGDYPFFILGPEGETIYPTQTHPTLEFPSATFGEIVSTSQPPHPLQSVTNSHFSFRAHECLMYQGPNPADGFDTETRPSLYANYALAHPEFATVKHFMGMSIHRFKEAIMVSMPVGLQEPKWAHFLSIDKSPTAVTFVEGEPEENSFYPIWTLYDKEKPGTL